MKETPRLPNTLAKRGNVAANITKDIRKVFEARVYRTKGKFLEFLQLQIIDDTYLRFQEVGEIFFFNFTALYSVYSRYRAPSITSKVRRNVRADSTVTRDDNTFPVYMRRSNFYLARDIGRRSRRFIPLTKRIALACAIYYGGTCGFGGGGWEGGREKKEKPSRVPPRRAVNYGRDKRHTARPTFFNMHACPPGDFRFFRATFPRGRRRDGRSGGEGGTEEEQKKTHSGTENF